MATKKAPQKAAKKTTKKAATATDRGLVSDIGIDILATILASKTKPQLRKLLAKIDTTVGKAAAAPFIAGLQEETAYWLKKNKIK